MTMEKEKELEELIEKNMELKPVGEKIIEISRDEELQGIIPKMVEEVKEVWRDIGYYTDEYGNRRYGVIP